MTEHDHQHPPAPAAVIALALHFQLGDRDGLLQQLRAMDLEHEPFAVLAHATSLLAQLAKYHGDGLGMRPTGTDAASAMLTIDYVNAVSEHGLSAGNNLLLQRLGRTDADKERNMRWLAEATVVVMRLLLDAYSGDVRHELLPAVPDSPAGL